MTALSFPLIPGRSAMDSLSLSTDGRIEPRQWCEAMAFDTTHPQPPAALRLRLGRITLKPRAVTAIIATAIVKAAGRAADLTRADLLALGLSGAEIDRHFGEGLKLALAREPRLAEAVAA